MRAIHSFDNTNVTFSDDIKNEAIDALESGNVIYFPKMPFQLLEAESPLLSPDIVIKGTKNISYLPYQGIVKGMDASPLTKNMMAQMMHRFVSYSTELIESLFPTYQNRLELGKTSFRPVQVLGRPSSYRKDDTRLHVDAFPSTPMQGKRILRVFSNVNPNGDARHWRIGENFEKVADKFLPQISKPLWGLNRIMGLVGATKGVRSDYDYYMNQIHNRMKKDQAYQDNAEQEEFFFPPNTTWMVMTDQVSHAAMSGQYVLEQTFYLPVSAMQNPEKSPLKILERKTGRKLA